MTTRREVRAGRLEVVVVAVHAHRRELVDLLLGEHAERAGDVDVDLGLDRLDAGLHLRHQPLVRAAHGGDDAELGRAGRRRSPSPPRPARGCSARPTRTGEVNWPDWLAEVAVLRAAAGLQRDDALDLDLLAAPLHPHVVREREQVGQLLVRRAAAPRPAAPGSGRRPVPEPAHVPRPGCRSWFSCLIERSAHSKPVRRDVSARGVTWNTCRRPASATLRTPRKTFWIFLGNLVTPCERAR